MLVNLFAGNLVYASINFLFTINYTSQLMERAVTAIIHLRSIREQRIT